MIQKLVSYENVINFVPIKLLLLFRFALLSSLIYRYIVVSKFVRPLGIIFQIIHITMAITFRLLLFTRVQI